MPQKGQLNGEYVKCEVCGTEIYKNQTQLKRSSHHYCSRECYNLGHRNFNTEERKCEICQKEFVVSKSSTQRFCSRKCQNMWQKTQSGILNKKFTRQLIKCDYCQTDYYAKKYKIDNGQHNFCSTECRQKWYAEVWSQSDEWKEESRMRAIRSISPKNTETKPQQQVNKLLDKCGIMYRNEEQFVYYAIDNYLFECHLSIEVMGDYWHANPLFFGNDLSDMQRKNIRRDHAKNTYLIQYHDMRILYLWEYDILNNIDVCELLIKSFINNNGVLTNYNSYNYIMDGGELKLKKDITPSHWDFL